MTHAILALLVQVSIGLLTGNWFLGGFAASAFYFGREHAQAEDRWITSFGGRVRSNMPWWGGFDPRAWNIKSVMDVALPVGVCTAIYLWRAAS